jgi:hypothetical protein
MGNSFLTTIGAALFAGISAYWIASRKQNDTTTKHEDQSYNSLLMKQLGEIAQRLSGLEKMESRRRVSKESDYKKSGTFIASVVSDWCLF